MTSTDDQYVERARQVGLFRYERMHHALLPFPAFVARVLRSLSVAAVLVGLVERAAGMQVVLTRRTEALRHHAGQVSFPGGGIDPPGAE